VAALVSAPLLWKQNMRVVLAGFECGLTIALGYISQAMALETIPSGECAFICSLTVVVVPLAAALLYGKPLELRHLAAAAVALLGVGILEGMIDITGGLAAVTSALHPAALGTADVAAVAAAASAASSAVASSLELAAPTAAAGAMNSVVHSYGPLDTLAKALNVETGDILALGQPLGFGYSFLRIEHYQEQFKTVPHRVLTIAAAQCVCVGAIATLWMLSDYHFLVPSFGYLVEPHRIAVILWTGIVTTLLAIYLEGVALQSATATDASIAFSSEPVWASLFGFWLLREQLGIESYVGGTVILAACLIGTLSDLQSPKESSGAPSLEGAALAIRSGESPAASSDVDPK
jgi:drug/metabolite transporter (DMT)-like permease